MLSVKKLLNTTVFLAALLSFFMGQEHLEPIFTFTYLFLLLGALLIDAMHWPRPRPWMINGLVLLLLSFIFIRIRFDTIVESFMEAILILIGVKMLEGKRARDYGEIFLLSLMILAAYGMLSTGKIFIFYCLGIALLSCFGLILTTCLAREPEMKLSVPESYQLFKTALRILLITLPVALLLFFTVPRIPTPMSGQRIASSNRSGTIGFSDQVRLGDVASIQGSEQLVFRAQMPALTKTPYWRGTVMDVFHGDQWNGSELSANEGAFLIDPNKEEIRQDIFMEPAYHRYFFALDVPFAIEGVTATQEGGAIFKNPSAYVRKRRHYTARSALLPIMRPAHSGNHRRFLPLPPDFSPRLQKKTDELTAGLSEKEKIRAILAFLSPPNFSYSLENLPVASDALEQFVFKTRKGNCEYFASAMGVMLRMAGIPSRLVSGYLGGYYSETGGYYIVNEDNAHVWVEAWEEKLGGWVRYDPTPVTEASLQNEGYSTLALYLDLMDYQWARLVMNYDMDTQEALLETFKKLAQKPKGNLLSPRALWQELKGMRASTNGSVILLLLLGGTGAAFFLLHRKPPEEILLRRFLRAVKRHGYTKHASEGLEEFSARIQDEELRIMTKNFAVIFGKAYFRDRPIDTETFGTLMEIIIQIHRFRKS